MKKIRTSGLDKKWIYKWVLAANLNGFFLSACNQCWAEYSPAHTLIYIYLKSVFFY